MLFIKIMIFILEGILLINAGVLLIMESKGFALSVCEDEIATFYDNHIVNNVKVPLEYKTDISQAPKIISILKNNPEEYGDIPKHAVDFLDFCIRICNGDEQLKHKATKTMLITILILFVYVLAFIFTTQPLF